MSAATKPFRAAPRTAAVLWDMDGTIVDTEPYWIATEFELVAEFGGEWSDEKAHSIVGTDLRDSAAVLRDQGGVDLPIDEIVSRLLDGVITRVQRKVPWRPGARELLADVRKAGVPNALVTMSWKRFADAVVAALPSGSFDVVITGDEVTHGKPHPEPYLAAASALGVDPKRCVAIEDSPTGVRSAVAAGCITFAVPNVVEVPEGKGFTTVGSLVELDLVRLGVTTSLVRKRRDWRRFGGAAIVAALAFGGAYLARPTPPPPLKNIPVSAWAPYWTLGSGLTSVRRHGTTMHEVSPFWFSATGVTSINFALNVSQVDAFAFVDAIRIAHAKVVPSITDGMPKGAMAAVLADPVSRKAHVAAISKIVEDANYDGIDLDYESFAFIDDKSTWPTTRANWVQFLTEMATELHSHGRLLSVSVPPIYDSGQTPDSGYWVYDYAAMGTLVDRIRVMGYDYSVASPGPIAPYDWVRRAIVAAKHTVGDDSKIVLGVGLYGRNWVVDTSGPCPGNAEGTTAVTQQSVVELMAKRNAVAVHDKINGEATFTYQLQVIDGASSCTQTREVHYIDVEGALALVDLARKERIGGVALWALGFDTGAFWTAINDVARPQE